MRIKVIGCGMAVVIAGALRAMDSQQQGYFSPSPVRSPAAFEAALPQRRSSSVSPNLKAALVREQLSLILDMVKNDSDDFKSIISDEIAQRAFINELVANGYTSEYLHEAWYAANDENRRTLVAAIAKKAHSFLKNKEHMRDHMARYDGGVNGGEELQFSLDLP